MGIKPYSSPHKHTIIVDEWAALSKQGQFARDSVLATIEGHVQLAGSTVADNYTETEGIYGCNSSDFSNDHFRNKTALIYRGQCKFEEKIINAARKGAKAVVIVNNQQDGVITMSIGGFVKNYCTKRNDFALTLRFWLNVTI